MQIKKCVCHSHSYGVFKGTSIASIGLQDINILSFVGVVASQPQYMSFLQNKKFVYCPLHRSSMRTGYGWMLKRMLTSAVACL